MSMLERVILIVDDNHRVETIDIESYKGIISDLKTAEGNEKWKNYEFSFVYKSTMDEAIRYLSDPNQCVDVVVVDYNFENDSRFTNGTKLVVHIRDKLNRFCKIIFYTMKGIDNIEKAELSELVNSDVYRIIDKSENNKEIAQCIFDAATQKNPIVDSLERFYITYQKLLETYNYTVFGEEVTFDQIIQHIRMDDEKGRLFLERLLKKAILSSTDIGGLSWMP